MITEALSYPRRGEETTKTIAIGGILSLLSFLLIPLFFLLGYTIRVLRASAAGEEHPPKFEDWGNLGVDGMKAFAIGLAYMLVPYALLFATAFLAADQVGGIVLFAFIIMGIALTLLASYAVPAALTRFAVDGHLGAAFDMSTLRPILTDKKYLVGWGLAVLVLIGSGIVTGMLNIIPILRTIVGVFVGFYALIAVSYIFGCSVANARPIESIDEPGIESPTVRSAD